MPEKISPSRLRPLWFVAGVAFMVLAVIGALLPVMPTTVFVILAAWCFGRSSPRLEAALLNHRRFGPPLRAWRARGAIPRRAKVAACLGMAFGYGCFLYAVRPGPGQALLVALVPLLSAGFVLSRPE